MRLLIPAIAILALAACKDEPRTFGHSNETIEQSNASLQRMNDYARTHSGIR